MKTIHVPISGRVDKYTAVFVQWTIKEQTIDLYNNLTESVRSAVGFHLHELLQQSKLLYSEGSQNGACCARGSVSADGDILFS